MQVVKTECMNGCKRGPNVSVYCDPDAAAVTLASMRSLEVQRGFFQGIATDAEVQRVYGAACAAARGELELTAVPQR
jgi:hypothetical protein